MAISYTGDWTNSLNDALDTISRVNSVSPKTTPVNATAASPNLFGMTPTATTQAFDTAYSKGTADYAPFQDSGVQKAIGQLQDVYNNIPTAYDVSGTLKATDAARSAALTTGTQAANTAATKFQESQIPGASQGSGAAMLRAQALLPYMQADTTAAQAEGQYSDSAKQTALTTAASIADNLATLQQNYTNSLAAYNSGKAQFGLSYANDQTGLALTASTANTNAALQAQEAANAQAEQAREANLSAALSTQAQQSQAAQTATNQQISAAQAILANTKAPTGSWVTNNNGVVTSGQNDYQAYQNYLAGRSEASNQLAKIA
jgi:hypothetical protein